MVYLIIIVVFFFLSFFSFPFILLASRFLSHLSSSLRVFFPFISYKFRAKPLFFCLFSSLSPFPVRHFPSFVSANLGGWEIPLRFSFGISPIFCIRQYWRMGNPAPYPPLLWGLSSLFCARHLRWRVSVSVVLLSPSLVGLFSVGLFPPLWGGPGWGYSSFFSQFICICQIFFVPLHRQKHQHLQYYIHSI